MTDQTKMLDADLVKPPTDAERVEALDFVNRIVRVVFKEGDLVMENGAKHIPEIQTISAALTQPVEQRFDVGAVRDFMREIIAETHPRPGETDWIHDRAKQFLALLDVPAPGAGDAEFKEKGE